MLFTGILCQAMMIDETYHISVLYNTNEKDVKEFRIFLFFTRRKF